MPDFVPPEPKILLGIAADHGGYELKEYLAGRMREAGYEVTDFGDGKPNEEDDYPDFIVPLARAVSSGDVNRGVGICGSGVGASVVANKVVGVRACLINESQAPRRRKPRLVPANASPISSDLRRLFQHGIHVERSAPNLLRWSWVPDRL